MCACVIVLQFVILSVLVNRCWEVERCLTFELYFALLLASTMILGVQFCKDDPRCIRLLYNSAERQSLNPVNLRISWSLLAPSPPLSCYPAHPLLSCSSSHLMLPPLSRNYWVAVTTHILFNISFFAKFCNISPFCKILQNFPCLQNCNTGVSAAFAVSPVEEENLSQTDRGSYFWKVVAIIISGLDLDVAEQSAQEEARSSLVVE